MNDEVTYMWRGDVTDEEMVELVDSHGGRSESGWWEKVRPHSLGWLTARSSSGQMIGFVNVAWDGGNHAFLLDTRTRGDSQHRGVGSQLVRQAAFRSREAGCEWLHVDFEPDLADFYIGACGFRTTDAGLIHLPTLG